jgi:hypothetical protein
MDEYLSFVESRIYQKPLVNGRWTLIDNVTTRIPSWLDASRAPSGLHWVPNPIHPPNMISSRRPDICPEGREVLHPFKSD